MFNIIWIPIYAQTGSGIAPSQGWWIFGDTFDNYSNNTKFYGINNWSGYNAITTGNGGPFTFVSGSPDSVYTAGLNDKGSFGGTWTGGGNYRLISSGYINYGGAIDNGGVFKIGHNTGYLLNDFTAEIWIKRLSDSWNPATFGRIIEKGFSDGFTINGFGANNIQSFVRGSNVNYVNPLPLNQWTHLAIVRSGSNLTVYMSGYYNNQGSVSSSALTNTSSLQLGTDTAEQAQYILLDEFRLWNYARSSGEITSNINNQLINQSGLINYLSFSEISTQPSGIGATTGIIYRQYELLEDNYNEYQTGTLSTITLPTSSLQDYGTIGGTWTGTTNTRVVSSGYLNYGGALDGGCFKIGHTPQHLLNDFTIEFWTKRLSDSWGTPFGRFIEKSFSNGFTMNRDGSNNKMNLSIMGDQDAYNNSIPLNQWTHFAAVRSGSTAFLYISGILDKQTATSSSQLANTDPLEVGTDLAEVADQLLMDEVRLWDYARSSGDIVANMGQRILSAPSGLINYLRFDSANGSQSDRIFLTGTYFYGKYESGLLSTIKNLTGFLILNSNFYNDTFNNYSTGYYVSGQLLSGYYQLGYFTGFASGILSYTGSYPY